MKKLALLFVFVQSLVFANNPVITLQGNNPMVLEVGTAYVDPGAIAWDEDDGDLTNQLQINGSVNSNILGTLGQWKYTEELGLYTSYKELWGIQV